MVSEDRVQPTAERFSHDEIEYRDVIVYDQDGRARTSWVPRASDTLLRMAKSGQIQEVMLKAGLVFRHDFARAHLVSLRAFDIERAIQSFGTLARGCRPVAENSRLAAIEGSRNRVWRALYALGGIGSLGGSCVWHVIGLEESLRDWSTRQNWNGVRVSPQGAPYVLIVALETLVQVYRIREGE